MSFIIVLLNLTAKRQKEILKILPLPPPEGDN